MLFWLSTWSSIENACISVLGIFQSVDEVRWHNKHSDVFQNAYHDTDKTNECWDVNVNHVEKIVGNGLTSRIKPNQFAFFKYGRL